MSNSKPRKMTFGLIVGNRGFFPGHLAQSGRTEMIAAIEKAGHDVVAVGPEETTHGAVESLAEASRLAELFRKHSDKIDGIVITLPNFGDERAIANTLRAANLTVPVLVQATPDTPGLMTIKDRRDSFCGKMSACNNLTQYRIPYSLTTLHTEAPDSDVFAQDLAWFAAVCRVGRGLGRARLRALGARPPCAAWCAVCAACASAPSARVLRRSTPCAIARNCWKPAASAWNRSTSRRSWAASSA